MNITQRIVGIMRDIGAIEKSRKNKDQGYQFRGIEDVYAEFHEVMAKHGVFCVPRVVGREDEVFQSKSGTRMLRSVISMEFDFVSEDGSKITVGPMIGEGNDMSDKASNKAMSVAQKYAFLQMFVVPTVDQAEPDGETVTPPQDAEHKKTQSAPIPQHRKKYVMPFGKHEGKHFDNIPLEDLDGSLKWLNSRDRLSPNQNTLKHELIEYLNNVADVKGTSK